MLPIRPLQAHNSVYMQENGRILPKGGPVPDAINIGSRIRAARKDAGLTQQELGDLAGVSQRTVRAIETGTGNPVLAAVVAVANVLGLHAVVES